MVKKMQKIKELKGIKINTEKEEIPNLKHIKGMNGSINSNNSNSRVFSPSHYTWLKDKCGIEVIDVTRHMDFNLGNAIKYILRAGHKSEEGYTDNLKEIEDLKKAVWYINDKIKMLEDEAKSM